MKVTAKPGSTLTFESKDVGQLLTLKFADGGQIENVLLPGSRLTMKLGTGIIGDIDAIIEDLPSDSID
ncbi:hypothetical protein EVB74_004 [Rhizobium phage RHph_Y3_56_1]|nr:hypothetical protein EVB59_004 [Rhizobium phage RHph_Y3_1]QIG77953.1 hypothetical protein EVB74_004 [Rhizobium phage RHph_Y3_56_1]